MAELNATLSYGNDVISTTEAERDQVRERPTIYFGTDDVKGALNAVMEIVTNGTDEVGAGHGDRIEIEVDSGYNITVVDNGRGVPMDWNEKDQRFNWDCVYNKMFSSGKRGQSAYSNAAGLNGVGAAITQFTSLWMKVISRRIEPIIDAATGKMTGVEHNEYEMNFKNGYPDGELLRRKWNPAVNNSGTVVKFKTDPTIFQEVRFSIEDLLYKVRRLATVSGGTHYIVRFMQMDELDVYFEDGPVTFLEMEADTRMTKDIIGITGTKETAEFIRGKSERFDVKVRAYFTFSIEKPFHETYHNNAYMIENGTSYDGFKGAVAQVIDNFAKKNNKINAKDRITNADVDDVLCAIVTSEFDGQFSSFDGQDKKAIKNEFLIGVVKQIVADGFTDWVSTHSDEVSKIVEIILANRAAKDKAAAVKRNVIKKMSSGVSSFKTRPAKLVDCEYGPEKDNEVYFVEGESAKGTAVLARDQKLQAVFALTGKILNCDKASIEAIFNNKVILDLIQILGCGVEVKSKYIKDLPKFDINKLNYSKVIISTDADLDGWHIQCLLIVFIFKVIPSLMKYGRLYIAEAPLYSVEYTWGGKKQHIYVYSDEELKTSLDKLNAQGITKRNIQRFKGLGEMDSEQLAETTMNPLTRRLTRVDWPEDVEAFEKTMHELMGNDLRARKEWVSDYFEFTRDENGAVEGIDETDDEDAYVAAVIED